MSVEEWKNLLRHRSHRVSRSPQSCHSKKTHTYSETEKEREKEKEKEKEKGYDEIGNWKERDLFR